MSVLILTGGGTGGHCLPHFAIYPELKNEFSKVYYIGSEKGIEKKLTEGAFEYFSICTAKLVRSFTIENLKIPFKLIKGIKQSEELLTRLKPSVVFSKGGFVAVPVVLAAAKLKIPVVAHESDLTLGLANRICLNKCKYMLTSFEKTATKPNMLFCGPPIRKEVLSGNKSRFLTSCNFLNKNKPTLLVFGGSGGSKSINSAIFSLLPTLSKSFNIVHIVGKGNKNTIANNSYRAFEYLDNIGDAYASADYAISRCGSNAAFELIANKIPTLFIPLSKKASRGDQILNAEYLLSLKLCKVLYEENLSNNSLIGALTHMCSHKDELLHALNNSPLKCGNKKIAQIIISCKS